MAARDERPKVTVRPASPYQLDRTINVGSDVGGCLISARVIDGRLRIEVYRADDTVDVVAPGLVMPKRDMSWISDIPRTPGRAV